MGMKIYVAASSNEISRAKFWIQRLREHGFHVTSTWPEVVAEVGDANPRDAGDLHRALWAQTDLDQVAHSDVLWFLVGNSKGAFVEYGYFHAKRTNGEARHLISSGDTKSSIFTALGREFSQDYDAFSWLLNVKEQSADKQTTIPGCEVSIHDLADAPLSGRDTGGEIARDQPRTIGEAAARAATESKRVG